MSSATSAILCPLIEFLSSGLSVVKVTECVCVDAAWLTLTSYCISAPGVLQKGQQWEVYTEGPAGGANAASPKVPSPFAGRDVQLMSNTHITEKPVCIIFKSADPPDTEAFN